MSRVPRFFPNRFSSASNQIFANTFTSGFREDRYSRTLRKSFFGRSWYECARRMISNASSASHRFSRDIPIIACARTSREFRTMSTRSIRFSYAAFTRVAHSMRSQGSNTIIRPTDVSP